MRLPISTDELQFIVATPPRPVPVFGGMQGQVRQDREGRPIYAFNVLATTGVDADVLSVKVAGEIEAAVGEAVRLRALTAEYWEMEGRSGVSFRAEGVDRGKTTVASGDPARKPPGDSVVR
jgi:hypothetical protein